MNLCEYLLENKDGSRPALMTLTTTYSYADLARAASAIATFLVSQGGRKGDRVLLLADNGYFWVVAYLGILRAGLVCVPLPVKLSQEDLRYVVSTVEPRFAFVESRWLGQLSSTLASATVITDSSAKLSPALHATTLDDLSARYAQDAIEPVAIAQDDLACLMFTSGSTGTPRGVMVTAGNIAANTNSIVEYLSLTSADRIMAVLPFHYCFGTSLLHSHLRVGGSMVMDSRFMYPEKILDRMLETECTGFAGVPSHYQILLRRSTLAKRNFPHLRYVQQAGGHLAPAFVKELRDALPASEIFIMYGQTEATARLAYLPPNLLTSRPGSIGKAIPGVKLSLIDEFGQTPKPHQIGEIVAEGANITRGYWRDPEQTARSFRDGKLYTGDLGFMDEDGFIYVVDRNKDFLKIGGKRVSCRYLEDMLVECGSVLEAAVVGIPDEVLGEAVKAFIIPRERKADGMIEQIGTFCRQHLAPSLIPKEIVVLDSLPKNSSGKVLKTLLRQQTSAASSHAQ